MMKSRTDMMTERDQKFAHLDLRLVGPPSGQFILHHDVTMVLYLVTKCVQSFAGMYPAF